MKDSVLYTGQPLYSRRARVENPVPLKKKSAPVRKEAVKSTILRVTGQKKIGDMISEYDALKATLKGEQAAGKEAFKAGKEEGWVKGATDVAAPAFKVVEKEGAQETREQIMQAQRERRWLNKQIAFLKGVAKIVSKKKLPSPQLEVLQDLLQGVDLQKPTEATKFHLNKLRDWLQNHEPESELSEEVMEQLSRLDKKPLRDMTVDEVNDLVNAVRHHITLARKKMQIRTRLGRQHLANLEQAAINELKTTKVNPDKVIGDVNARASPPARPLAPG